MKQESQLRCTSMASLDSNATKVKFFVITVSTVKNH